MKFLNNNLCVSSSWKKIYRIIKTTLSLLREEKLADSEQYVLPAEASLFSYLLDQALVTGSTHYLLLLSLRDLCPADLLTELVIHKALISS